MPRKILGKTLIAFSVAGCLGVAIASQYIGQVFFINRTESMPRGIYIKIAKEKLELGDIVISKSEHFRGYLLKYIAATSPSEICIIDGEGVYVDGNILAQPNIEKYPLGQSPQCRCEKLKADELFVIGDHPNSYDSRYFGPIKIENVFATVELLWAFKSVQ